MLMTGKLDGSNHFRIAINGTNITHGTYRLAAAGLSCLAGALSARRKTLLLGPEFGSLNPRRPAAIC
jgi:hypothetical protein